MAARRAGCSSSRRHAGVRHSTTTVPVSRRQARRGCSPTGVGVLHGDVHRAGHRLATSRAGHLERRVLARPIGDVASTDAHGASLAAADRGVLDEDDLQRTGDDRLTERDGVAVRVGEVEVRVHRVVADEDVLRSLALHARRVVGRWRAGHQRLRLRVGEARLTHGHRDDVVAEVEPRPLHRRG